MSTDRKKGKSYVCPLLTARGVETPCMKLRCEWYDGRIDRCSIYVIANALDGFLHWIEEKFG